MFKSLKVINQVHTGLSKKIYLLISTTNLYKNQMGKYI